jgi:hypothetical protein
MEAANWRPPLFRRAAEPKHGAAGAAAPWNGPEPGSASSRAWTVASKGRLTTPNASSPSSSLPQAEQTANPASQARDRSSAGRALFADAGAALDDEHAALALDGSGQLIDPGQLAATLQERGRPAPGRLPDHAGPTSTGRGREPNAAPLSA